MKLEQKFRLAEEYNRADTTIIIASYPERTNRSIKEIDAVASYTDHFARSFKKELAKSNQRVIVFAQKNGKEEWYKEGNMLICRVWDKGHAMAYAQILSSLFIFPNVKNTLVQFEFHQFGGKITTGLFPIFLSALRLFGKSVNLVMHQVVEDIRTLSGHLNLNEQSLMPMVYNMLLRGFYRMTSYVSNTITVHSSIFAKRFTAITGREDIHVIPHGLGAIRKTISKTEARRILGFKQQDFVMISFGFLAWYKGSDWITETVAHSKRKHIKLLLAGGASPNIKTASHYKTFLKKIESTAKNSPAITMTGFVEDADIPLYFAACDLAVLPYRSLMSSSGPLAMAIAFEKPFLLSHTLAPYLKDSDFKTAIAESKLSANRLLFSHSTHDFWEKVIYAKRNVAQFKKLSTYLRSQRVWPEIAKRFAAVINTASLENTKKFAILEGSSTTTYAHT